MSGNLKGDWMNLLPIRFKQTKSGWVTAWGFSFVWKVTLNARHCRVMSRDAPFFALLLLRKCPALKTKNKKLTTSTLWPPSARSSFPGFVQTRPWVELPPLFYREEANWLLYMATHKKTIQIRAFQDVSALKCQWFSSFERRQHIAKGRQKNRRTIVAFQHFPTFSSLACNLQLIWHRIR